MRANRWFPEGKKVTKGTEFIVRTLLSDPKEKCENLHRCRYIK